MKRQIFRRVGAPFLALVLALALAMGMAAPVLAAPDGPDATSGNTGESASPGDASSGNTGGSASPGETSPGGTGGSTTPGETSPGGTTPPGTGTAALTGIAISPTGPVTLENKTEATSRQVLTVRAQPEGAVMDGTLKWEVNPTPGVTSKMMELPTLQYPESSEKGEVTGGEIQVSGATFANRLTGHGPGDFTVRVTYTDKTGRSYPSVSVRVVFSGILLSLTGDNNKMFVGDHWTVAVDGIFGRANDTNSATSMSWSSSDPSVASVQGSELTAYQLGTARITATRNGYSARFTVKVVEDQDVIAGSYQSYKDKTISTSNPLVLMAALGDLNAISLRKTQEVDEYGDPVEGSASPLNYITGLKVPTSQGTLYFNYSSEANTGAGVGFTDRFAGNSSGAIHSLGMLYFVPKQGFKGIAEITFTGWARNGTSFDGVIKVAVGVTTSKDENGNVIVDGDASGGSVTYRTQAGDPVWFLYSDFNTFFQNLYGRGMNYLTFSLPPASQGTLYYNYAGGTGIPISTTTRFTPSGVYTLNNVCFVPNAAFTGDAEISFSGADTAGNAVIGQVVVTVDRSVASYDPTNVYLSGERGKAVALQSTIFNEACQNAINDTLSYVTFKLPASSEGTLYYNYQGEGSYDGRVSATTRYYFSGVPGISGVYFVPSFSTAGQVAISYTGYGSMGTSFSGTLYIRLDEADRTTIRYFVAKNGYVDFRPSDFNTAALYGKGVSVDHVRFGDMPDGQYGSLRYDYRSSSNPGSAVSTGASYFYRPSNSLQNGLDLISFRAEDKAATVRISYTAYNDKDEELCGGFVEIQIGSPAPSDVRLSCKNSEQATLSSVTLRNVCLQAMTEGLSYIEITGVPDALQGHLYFNYYGFGTGTVVKQGERFYCYGAPRIDYLSFVPHAGFSGEAEITYIGYGSNAQDPVSGRITVNVARSQTSWYFNDMRGYEWAIDSTDYLYWNGTVEGVGGGRFAPAMTMTKGDFTLMLVRAYGLSASGSASFKDVPAGSYYADAIRIAALLGVAGGSNGYYYPTSALSRQDAMLMIYNALKASGVTVTNGLAADFSVYRDERSIAAYAREAIGSLIQMGVVEGDGSGYLRPERQLSRAEAAKLLHAIMTL